MTVNRPIDAYVSVGIFAWNEEKVIGALLNSLFEQSLIQELRQRGFKSEILCVVNGSEDRTPEIAEEVFQRQRAADPESKDLSCRVVVLAERGKLNAWNQFVHRLSARGARYLIMMDADIRLETGETLARLLSELETNSQANISVDQPLKEFGGVSRNGWRQRLSTGAAQITQAAAAQLCAQLYCIRSEVARNIYLPKDLAACEDGFIKALVCTDFLTTPVNPERIRRAPGAAHAFEAYTAPAAVLKNQKRQIIGQTVVHVLVDQYLTLLPMEQRRSLSATLKKKDLEDPGWLKRLVHAHVRRVRFCWRLYPDLLNGKLRRLHQLPASKRWACLPAALASAAVAWLSSFLAYRFLKAGGTDYWPKADRMASGAGAALALKSPMHNPR